jgi:hypothetical protein
MKKVAARAMSEDVRRDSDLEIGRFGDAEGDAEMDESILQSRLNLNKSFLLKLGRPRGRVPGAGPLVGSPYADW